MFTSGVKAPSRSSIFVSRSSGTKPASFSLQSEVTSERVPVVKLPAPGRQKVLTEQDLNDLVNAGYTITPVPESDYIRTSLSKRNPQPIRQGAKNHVVYENPQEGVHYQYSPGSSDSRVTIKTKN